MGFICEKKQRLCTCDVVRQTTLCVYIFVRYCVFVCDKVFYVYSEKCLFFDENDVKWCLWRTLGIKWSENIYSHSFLKLIIEYVYLVIFLLTGAWLMVIDYTFLWVFDDVFHYILFCCSILLNCGLVGVRRRFIMIYQWHSYFLFNFSICGIIYKHYIHFNIYNTLFNYS